MAAEQDLAGSAGAGANNTALNASMILGNLTANLNGTADLPVEPTEEELKHSLLIFYIVMFSMITAQSALVSWRKRHRRSYELVTLVGLWLIPPVLSAYLALWRFVAVWTLYSTITGFFLYQCAFGRALSKTLPKMIYTWFYRVFKASVGLGSVGYVMLLTQVFGGVPFFFADGGTAVVLVWYGLYYGILTRDCAEVASDRIANRLGGARRLAVSVRDCGICGAELRDAHGGGGTGAEASVQLSCKHLFHEECIRGWLIVGKKDSCPTCTEKVDLRALYAGKPWETSNLSWVQMLDMVRYLVVWQPTILVALHFLLHVAHLDEAPAGGGGGVGNNGSLVGAAVNGSAGNATFGGGGAFLG